MLISHLRSPHIEVCTSLNKSNIINCLYFRRKDRVTNEKVRVRTGQHSMDEILSERRHRWLGRNTNGSPLISTYLGRCCTGRFRGLRGPGCPCTNWRSTVNKDLLRMGITWEEAEVAAQNRSEWCRSVAQCIHLDEG